MLHTLAFSSLAALATALAPDTWCRTPPPSEALLQAIKQVHAQEQTLSSRGLAARANVVVDTYVHVVSVSETQQGGNVPDEAIQNQMATLNQAMSATGFSFTLKSVDRTVNSVWANYNNELEMTTRLRKGSYKDLNLYFVTKLPGVAGYCRYPELNTTPGSKAFMLDGCIVQFDHLPGGTAPHNNQGKYTVHEVGHWLGLLHTFDGNCSEPNDYVDDTPAHVRPRLFSDFLCPAGANIDTCPSMPGTDPVNNYMNYKVDACFLEFTRGQINRMASIWRYRDPSAVVTRHRV